ncbi:LysR substrate-binding domain-containing protein [Orbus mooreae]|uniref:LysR substrate-binding domain-containing protein n=1 Tax=Orbus mooreae TaxID=3074107 RepID=UPI00370D0F36
MKVFQAIIKYGSIRAASRALNQSQPALTRSMKELESSLGTALIIRGVRGVQLTEAGRLFSIRMEVILSELQKATEELQYVNEQAEGYLRIGCSSLILLTIYPKMLAEFKKFLPKASLFLKEGQLSVLMPELRENKLDFAIGTVSENIPLNEFIEEPLFKAPFTILCRKGHSLENCTDLEQLRSANWLVPATDMGYYQQIQNFLQNTYNQLDSAPLFTDSIICGLNLALKSDYLMIIAYAMSKPLLLDHALSEIKLQSPLPEATYSLIYPRNTPLTLTANRMIKILRWHSKNTDWNQLYN